ncbi:TPA: alpha/beta hydrolase [Pasteurella multocida]|uniref:alpha/beta fold hydrolase n=1 Tax=Pasteurella multocida TaxID=747 RepID=UPI0020203858|nr:alpha/beta hydrolase [Pasteurella multocida]MCL7798442.1 alpha/beta hydrolase [Pasteurella multocida]MCL7802072.1 alpha/beta hydrolase [Pasteurella multocida]MDG2542110.1 alpha/beta hydrolase [Pasteurella multocida]URH96008.1 alpha/beta hydrolase [Pasteurella multocida]HDR1070488.1 alpha/beta hydrolase [Pasteurella multocida]
MIREPHFTHFALAELHPFAAQFPLQDVQGKKGVRITYRHFVQDNPVQRNLVILVNGRAENLLKWTELAYDFYQQGYDVLVFDHRGQGYSQRLLPDHEKGYIDEFRFYADDMAILLAKISALYPYENQHILAHSLGALISTYYLANYDHQVKSAVFSAPFYGIPLKHSFRDELIINLMMLLGQGSRYVFGKGRYQPADLDNNDLSCCRTRMRWMNRINRRYPHIHLGGPTFRWVHLCFSAIKKLPTILPRIEIPVLILQSEKEKIVENKNLRKLTALLPRGELTQIAQSKHEILFERDLIRSEALKKISQFFTANSAE